MSTIAPFFDKRPKFLHYEPQSLLLTALEFDHADIYRDLEHVKQAFRALLQALPPDAHVVACADFPHALDVCSALPRRATFGTAENAEWRLVNFYDAGEQSVFEIQRGGSRVGTCRLRLPGLMNARNALGVIVLATHLGVPPQRAIQHLADFCGVARRQEVVGEFSGVLLIDDFAHHPTAVRATLEALRERYPKRRLWAVFEPRSNTSRRKVFQKDYADALGIADRVIVGGVLRKASDPVNEEQMFSPQQLVEDLQAAGVRARTFADVDTIAVAIARNVRPGDVVVLLSNGDFGGLRGKLVDLWQERAPQQG